MRENYSVFAPKQPKKNGVLRVRVKFTDTGNVYDIVLVETDVLTGLVDENGFVAVPGLVPVDEATMEKAKSILRDLVESGFFDGLAPIDQ